MVKSISQSVPSVVLFDFFVSFVCFVVNRLLVFFVPSCEILPSTGKVGDGSGFDFLAVFQAGFGGDDDFFPGFDAA